ncbi:hypothetical protein DV738_g2606, partial [Chaetothyriales sp. CBS 135597]
MAPTPITILTGFLGAGKTTLILKLVDQLPSSYRLALLKNEFGDVAVDSQLARQQAISGTRELLNGCICCNLVGQLGDALFELRAMQNPAPPSRIVIETSGSAFPATLAMEVNRLIVANPGAFVLDGVISVIDVENWTGYDDHSPTARMQAKYTDLIVFNKWEAVSERRFDDCLDRVGDLEVHTPWVKSDRGWVDKDVILGVDGALIAHVVDGDIEAVDLDKLESLLLGTAPKDEVYRIKGLLASTQPPKDSNGQRLASPSRTGGVVIYVLNWAFGRWTYTALSSNDDDDRNGAGGAESTPSVMEDGSSARLTFILARGESNKWKKKLEQGNLIALTGGDKAELTVRKIQT